MYSNAAGITGGGFDRSGIPGTVEDLFGSWSLSLLVAFGGVNGRES